MSQTFSEDDVRHVAHLSRLKVTDEEVASFSTQLTKILGFVEQLSELDVEGVEPMPHPTDMTNCLREDIPSEPLPADEAIKNAPETHPPFFKVPKVLGDGGGA